MPQFDVSGPDGHVVRVDAPEGATVEQAVQYAQNNWRNLVKPNALSSSPVPIADLAERATPATGDIPQFDANGQPIPAGMNAVVDRAYSEAAQKQFQPSGALAQPEQSVDALEAQLKSTVTPVADAAFAGTSALAQRLENQTPSVANASNRQPVTTEQAIADAQQYKTPPSALELNAIQQAPDINQILANINTKRIQESGVSEQLLNQAIVGMASGYTGGLAEKMHIIPLGSDIPPDPRDLAQTSVRGLSQFAGFILNPVTRAAVGDEGVAGALSALLGKHTIANIASEVVGLGIAGVGQSANEILDANNHQDALKIVASALGNYGAMGAVFGGVAAAIPEVGLLPFVTRAAAINTAMYALGGTSPLDTSAQGIFNTALNTWFARSRGNVLDPQQDAARDAAPVMATETIEDAIAATQDTLNKVSAQPEKSVADILREIRPLKEVQNGTPNGVVPAENISESMAGRGDFGAGNDTAMLDRNGGVRADGLEGRNAEGIQADIRPATAGTAMEPEGAGLRGAADLSAGGQSGLQEAGAPAALKGEQNAIQERGTESVLQREQGQIGATGRERERMESGQQGTEIAAPGERNAGNTKTQEALINIGLLTDDGKGITEQQVRKELAKLGVSAQGAVYPAQFEGDEPKFAARLSRQLTPEEMHQLAIDLNQRVIPQVVNGKGEMYGPGAEEMRQEYGPFNPKYFTAPDGGKIGEVPELAVSHYSKELRPILNGKFYGTGARGREAERLSYSTDPRIKNRISFYVDEGGGVHSEPGVGNVRHDVKLNNLYDGATNPLRLPADNLNDFESAVLDAGFDGYYIKEGFGRQGAAVLMGDAANEVHTTAHNPAIVEKLAQQEQHNVKLHEALAQFRTYGLNKAINQLVQRGEEGKRGGVVFGTEEENNKQAAEMLAKKTGVSVAEAMQSLQFSKQDIQKREDSLTHIRVRTEEEAHRIASEYGGRLTELGPYGGWEVTTPVPRSTLPDNLFSHSYTETNGFYSPELGTLFVHTDRVPLKDIVPVTMHEIMHMAGGTEQSEALDAETMRRLDVAAKIRPAANAMRSVTDQTGKETMFSPLLRAIEKMPQNKGTPQQWEGILNNLTKKGVAPEELEFTGIMDRLNVLKNSNVPFVSKDELLSYLDTNQVKIAPKIYGYGGESGGKPLDVQFGDYETQKPDPGYLEDNALERMRNMSKDELSGMLDYEVHEHPKGTVDLFGKEVEPIFADEINALHQRIRSGHASDNEEIEALYDKLFEDAVTQETRWYFQDGDSPQTRTITADAGDNQYDFTEYTSYGDTEITDWKGKPVELPRRADDADIEQEIRRHLAEHYDVYEQNENEGPQFEQLTLPGGKKYRERLLINQNHRGEAFEYRNHFEDENSVAHTRVNDREVPRQNIQAEFPELAARLAKEGRDARVYFIEEAQSDWAQHGREKPAVRVPYKPEDLSIDEDASGGLHNYWIINAAGGNQYRIPTQQFPARAEALQYVLENKDYKTPGTENAFALYKKRADLERQRVGIQDAIARAESGGQDASAALHNQLVDITNQIHAIPGYSTDNVPPGAYVQSTDAWVALVLKDAIHEAAAGGYDLVAWTTGGQQVQRWNRGSRQRVDIINWEKSADGNIHIIAKQRDTIKADTHYGENDLSAAIGKTMAKIIIEDPNQSGSIAGNDITVADLGMVKFYGDSHGNNPDGNPAIVTKVANRILSKLGGDKVKEANLFAVENTMRGRQSSDTDVSLQPTFEITPKMREAALAGQSQYSKQGNATGDIYGRVRARMESAGQAGNPQESTSYLVEEAMKMGQTAGHSRLDSGFWAWAQKALPPSAVNILKKWVANIRAAMFRNGVVLKAQDLTIDDFVAVAQANMRALARGDMGAYAGGNKYENDIKQQQDAMEGLAKERGHANTDEFATKEPDEFNRAAEQWRQQHPMRSVKQDTNNKEAAERAGFDTSTVWLHGTTKDFKSFRVGNAGVNELGSGIYLTSSPTEVGFNSRGLGGRVIQAYIKKGDLFDYGQIDTGRGLKRDYQIVGGRPSIQEREQSVYEDIARRIQEHPERLADSARGWADEPVADLAKHIKDSGISNLNAWLDRAGYIGAYDKTSQYPNQVVIFDPKNIRSINAQFKLAKADSTNIMASRKGEGAPHEETKAPKAATPSWLGAARRKISDVATALINDAQLAVAPMAAGGKAAEQYRAIAKDYANAERASRMQWSLFDKALKENYTPEQLRAMWDAADEQNVLMQEGKDTTGKGLDRLPADQRATMDTLHQYGEELLQQAKDAGMFKGEGLPYWTPRMAVMIGDDGEYALPPRSEKGAGATQGRNITATSPSLKQRKYLTAQETEAAMKAKFGDKAELVRDIRAMPMAMQRLERAVAGRELINQIKALGKRTGEELVSTDAQPGYFTIDHPAFKTYRPKMIEVDGKITPAIDQNGDMIFERNPLYMRDDLKGPLKSIMSEQGGKFYLGAMELKGKVMSAIMYSPLIHNAVEFGRAMPMLPGKVLTLRVYFDGNKAKNDPVQMRQAIQDGMVPIGHRGGIQDITGVLEEPNIKPGRSLTAKAIGGAIGLANQKAGEAVKRGIDTAGDVWHNTLLWDRIGDLQMGIYVNVKDIETQKLVKAGLTPEQAAGVAGKIAGHMANRYAGALPNESMSAMSRKIFNLTLFSRSFTLGNLGVMKDVFTGLPLDVQAQVKRDYGELALRAGKDVARRKAIGAFIIDIGLMYAANSIMQDTFDRLKRGKTSGTIDTIKDLLTPWQWGRLPNDIRDKIGRGQIEQGYIDRFYALLHHVQENPLAVLNSPLESISSLTSSAGNEPGKEERALYGYDKNGTAIYVRIPTGKIGEEFIGWSTTPLDMLKRKESTFTRPIIQTATNDKGFGQRVYNPDDPGVAGAVRNIGKVVANFMVQQIPNESLQSLINLAGSHGTEMDAYKVLGPLLGLTFSKGSQGGPVVGEMYHVDKVRRAAIADAMPAIRDDIKNGKQDMAVQKMLDIGMTQAEIRLTLEHVLNPESRLKAGNMRKFMRNSTDADKEKMQGLQNR